MNELWRCAEGTLPVIPVVQASTGDNRCMLWGVLYSRTLKQRWNVAVNYIPIPDFCGGVQFSAVNVWGLSLDPKFMRTTEHPLIEAHTAIEDLFTEEQLRLWDVIEDAEHLRTRYGRMVLGSLCAAIHGIFGAQNRNTCVFWDTYSGTTRMFFEWMWNQIGACKYPAFGLQLDFEAQEDGHKPSCTTRWWGDNTHCYPATHGAWLGWQSYTRGRGHRNRNSGNSVSTSVLYSNPVSGMSARTPIHVTHVAANALYEYYGKWLTCRVPSVSSHCCPIRFYPQ